MAADLGCLSHVTFSAGAPPQTAESRREIVHLRIPWAHFIAMSTVTSRDHPSTVLNATDRIAELARKQPIDHRLAVSGDLASLAPGSPIPSTEVIQHDVSVLIRSGGAKWMARRDA